MKVIFTVLLIIAVLFALIFSLDLLLGYRYQNAFLKTLDPFRKMEKEEFITLALFFIVYIIKQVIRLYKKRPRTKTIKKAAKKSKLLFYAINIFKKTMEKRCFQSEVITLSFIGELLSVGVRCLITRDQKAVASRLKLKICLFMQPQQQKNSARNHQQQFLSAFLLTSFPIVR